MRLQGHRKRRRIFEIAQARECARLKPTEYKTIRQYQTMGDMLDEFKTYGFRMGIENITQRNIQDVDGNGHTWLTEDV